jgi:hypothetical protein
VPVGEHPQQAADDVGLGLVDDARASVVVGVRALGDPKAVTQRAT